MGIANIAESKLLRMGIRPDYDINRSMAEFYTLERLHADGSKKAGSLLYRLEQDDSPVLLNYLSAICGGELRHAARMFGASQGCDGWNCSGERSRDCSCCGESESSEYYCLTCNEYKDEHNWNPDTEEDEIEGECPHHYVGQTTFEPGGHACGCYCPTELCYDCENAQSYDGGDLEEYAHPKLAEWLSDYADWNGSQGRSSAWVAWRQFHAENPQAMRWAADCFYNGPWDGSYGGENWGLIAKIAADFEDKKLSPRLFMDRCWTLQHNGGNIFDKMWDYDSTRVLMKALEAQAKDNYGFLQAYCSTATRTLWKVRDYRRFDMFDRDPAWLGVQRTFDPEVDW